jgi:hypothetical protein
MSNFYHISAVLPTSSEKKGIQVVPEVPLRVGDGFGWEPSV